MTTQTSESYYALTLSIVLCLSPEESFETLSTGRPPSNRHFQPEEIEDMVKLKYGLDGERKHTFSEVGQLYGISKDAAYNWIRRHEGRGLRKSS